MIGMALVVLPNFMALKSYYRSDEGYAYYQSDNSIVFGEQDVFSTPVKIAVEPSTSNKKYVHLRFVYNNGYWARNAEDQFINTTSKQPVEDITNPACTLFEPFSITSVTPPVLYLIHVQSGGRVLMYDASGKFYVHVGFVTEIGYFTYVDWESLVKLPTHVAFRGDNDMYLQATTLDGDSVLQFASSNPIEIESGHQVTQMNDGRVQITSDLYGKMWWSKDDWVYGDWSDEWDPESAIFTPVRINEGSTIALRSNGPYSSSNFCKRVTTQAMVNCLAPATADIDEFSRLVVQELVQERTIYDAVYDVANARIYNETPHVAGKTVLTNDTDADATMPVEITYQNEISCSFSRSVSLTAGVETTFQVGVPVIQKSEIVISFDINTVLYWDTAATTTKSVTASGSVLVPAMTSAVVEYVGTKGTCDVPFSYSQKDVRSTDGVTVTTNQTDGIYTGVNSYNFNFVVTSTTPISV